MLTNPFLPKIPKNDQSILLLNYFQVNQMEMAMNYSNTLAFIINLNYKMENIEEQEEDEHQGVPKSQPTKTMGKIANTRFLNQNIYNTFLQKRYGECLSLINKSGADDQFKIYIKSLIQKNSYKLDKSLDLLNQCHIMDKLNYSYLKSISKNYYLLGKYKSSLEVAKEAHRMNSNDYEIFYILGKISEALGDKTNAMAYFKTAVGKEPNQQSYLAQAKISISNSDFIQAIDFLNECVRVSPQNPEAYEMMGLCYSKIGKNQEAYGAYRSALLADAERYASLIGIGSIELQRNQIDEALQSFTKAYKNSSNSAALWSNVGVAMTEKKKFVAAYCCFKRALFLDPFRWDFHTNLALLFIKKQKFLPAKIHLQSALKLSKDPTLFNLLGICLLELNDSLNAVKSFEQSLKMNPSFADAKYNLILGYLKQDQKNKAQQLFAELQRQFLDESLRDRLLNLKMKLVD